MQTTFGIQVAADVAQPPRFETLAAVPRDQTRLIVRCAHPRRGPTTVAKVAGNVIKTEYMEYDYVGAPQEVVEMTCENCLRLWKVPKSRLRKSIDAGETETTVKLLTDRWSRMSRREGR